MQNFDPATMQADIAALKAGLASVDIAGLTALAAKVESAVALLTRLEQFVPMLAKQFETEVAGIGAATGVIAGETIGTHSPETPIQNASGPANASPNA